MPELPEVETIRSYLQLRIPGWVVKDIRIWRRDVIVNPVSVRTLVRRVCGWVVRGVERRGKYLIVNFHGSNALVFHLRLAGHIELVDDCRKLSYECLRLTFTNGAFMSLVDPRVLARVYLVDYNGQQSLPPGLIRMGPEPLSRDFRLRWFLAKINGRRRAIKSLLLDQRICCGVGNIYSDEALFRSGILPTRAGGNLDVDDVRRLVSGLRSVLREGIRYGGTTLSDGRYLKPDGNAGDFGRRLAVFGRLGKPCFRCRGTILRVRVSGRGSYYCPTCQH